MTWQMHILGLLLAIGTALSSATAPTPAHAQDQLRAALPGEWEVGNLGRGNQMPLFATPGNLFSRTGAVRDGDRILHMGCTKVMNLSWCEVQKLQGDRATGYLREKYIVQGAKPKPVTESKYLVVHGLKRDERLNVRRDPSARSRVLATLGEGERVLNLGCQRLEGQSWCRIRSLEGVEVTGWANGAYLRAASTKPSPDDGPEAAWEVSGLRGNQVLPLHETARATSPVLLSLVNGDRVANLGCRPSGSTDWCRVTFHQGVTVTGWVDGRYLRRKR